MRETKVEVSRVSFNLTLLTSNHRYFALRTKVTMQQHACICIARMRLNTHINMRCSNQWQYCLRLEAVNHIPVKTARYQIEVFCTITVLMQGDRCHDAVKSVSRRGERTCHDAVKAFALGGLLVLQYLKTVLKFNRN